MATITIQIIAGAQNFTHTKTVSATHLVRMLAAYRTILGQIPAGSADPVTGIVPMRDMTDAETAAAWATGLFNGTKANVLRAEQASAAQTASTSVAEIGMT